MKNLKSIWFITHDGSSIDHRITTFMNWSEKNGYLTRLFSANNIAKTYSRAPFIKISKRVLVPHILKKIKQIELESQDMLESGWQRCIIDNCIFYVSRNSDDCYYLFKKYLIHTLFPFEHVNSQDEYLGSMWDWDDFKKNIYDFTPILNYVLDFLRKRTLEKPSLLYVADLPTLPIGILLKLYFGIPLIFDAHEWWEGQTRIWTPEKVKAIDVIHKYEKKLYPLCDLRLGVGKLFSSLLSQACGCLFNPIYTTGDSLSHGISQNDCNPMFWQEKLGLPLSSKVVIFQGSLTDHRNLGNMVNAVKYLTSNQFLIVLGEGTFRRNLENIIEDKNLHGRVIFVGCVPQDELLTYSKHAHLGLIPYVAINQYYSTSMPNKFSEYIAAHVPMIVDKSMHEICQIVENYEYGIISDYTNPQILGRCISKLLDNEIELARIKSNFITKPTVEFDPCVQSATWKTMLQKLGSVTNETA